MPPLTPMLLQMHDYTRPAKAYWWSVTALGALALALALRDVAHAGASAMLQVALGVVLAGLAGSVPVRMPGMKTSIAGAEIFVFLLFLLLGPSAAALASA